MGVGRVGLQLEVVDVQVEGMGIDAAERERVDLAYREARLVRRRGGE